MDHDTVSFLRASSAAWRLLRADSAPFVLAVLGQVFIVDNVRTIAEADLVARVDDILYSINAASPDRDDHPPYPRSARDYVDTWAAPEQGWLRKFYPEGSDEAHYDATADVEKAYAFVTGLRAQPFVGTQSRLQTIVELLREIVAGSDPDPAVQLARLQQRRDEIDAEIARVVGGEAGPMSTVSLLDRYQHFARTSRELLADFRAVEDNFRSLDRSIRADIAAWDGTKGELLDEVVGQRTAISESDQGRSFQAFHDFLLSRTRREEMTELLERLVGLDSIEVDRTLGKIHFDWLDAAERTQQTVRLLSEQLRRFLDDKVWLENRRVVELLRSIERSALALREVPAPDLAMPIAATSPDVRLPFERPLYAPSPFTGVDPADLAASDDALDLGTLFDQVYVDPARLTATVRAQLRHRDQVSLEELLREHPPTQGLAELVAYLALSEEDFDVVVDESSTTLVVIDDDPASTAQPSSTPAHPAARAVRMPRVLLVRRAAAAIGGRS